ncbi:MAG TPA: flagellar protein FlgN [candidate division Zixibacteria bacterium]|nr:flagellar protein FlgN [candidate division Zixibacteria bacterium]
MTDRLVKILSKEVELFETFLSLLQRQQELLVANDRDGLSALTETLREKTIESQLLNRQREEEIERIKVVNAIEGDLNVTRLLELIDSTRADQLTRLRDLVYSLHNKITRTRNQNALLINRSRESIARMMEMLSRVNGPRPTYARDGANAAIGDNVVVDRSA